MKCFSSGWILLVIFMGIGIFQIIEAQTTDSGTTDGGTGGTTDGDENTTEPETDEPVDDSDNQAGGGDDVETTTKSGAPRQQVSLGMGLFAITMTLTYFMS